MVSARFRKHSRGLRNHFATTCYLRRAAKLASTLRFPAFLSRYMSGNFRRESTTLYKKAAKFSQQKADSATLWKMLPSAWSDWLAMAATSSFQLQIAHRLKHWILDFLSFEMPFQSLEIISQPFQSSKVISQVYRSFKMRRTVLQNGTRVPKVVSQLRNTLPNGVSAAKFPLSFAHLPSNDHNFFISPAKSAYRFGTAGLLTSQCFETRYRMHNLSSQEVLSKMCPIVAKWSCDISATHGLHSHLQMAITFPFQIQIEHCPLKLWTPDFTSFETRYCINYII
uniref:Uncharacterized protein n=1 Tax=Vitis vinifera TaxID=29760 RepID=A5C7A4_VITVI|nr:hypothetical protein VITISV_036610 [Vitis vinifera]